MKKTLSILSYRFSLYLFNKVTERTVYFVLITLAAHTLPGCEKKKNDLLIKHYTDTVYSTADSIWKTQSQIDAVYYLDSVYAGFTHISVPDKCQYYFFRSKLFEHNYDNPSGTDSAMAFVDSAITLIEKNQLAKQLTNEYAQAFNLKGEYALFQRNYTEAFKAVSMCRLLSEQTGDSCTAGDNCAVLGLIAYQQRDFPKAAVYFKQAIGLFRYCKNDMAQFYRMQGHLDNLGLSYAKAGQPDSAFKYYQTAIAYIEQNKHLYKDEPRFPAVALAVVYGNLAKIYEQKKDFVNAEKYLLKVQDIFSHVVYDSIETAQAQIQLAEFYVSAGRINEAEKKIANTFEKISGRDPNYKTRWYLIMQRIAEKKNNIPRQLYFLQQYYASRDSLNEKTKEILRIDPFTEYERLQKNYQVSLLNEKDKRNHLYLVMAVIVGLFALVIALMVYSSLKKSRLTVTTVQKLNADLIERETQLKQLMQERELQEKQKREEAKQSALREERERISQELHDDLGTGLTSIRLLAGKVLIKNTPAENSFRMLGDINKISGDMVDQMGEIVWLMNHMEDTLFGLLSHLRIYMADYLARTGFEMKLNFENWISQDYEITGSQRRNILLAVKEAFNNAVKHSGATQLDIICSNDESSVQIIINDNGKGFNTALQQKGNGVKNINKRAKAMNGTALFDTTHGTKITLTIPINDAGKATDENV
ncbi:MAG: ATP-binding protein [Ferruginibacter sp.]